MSTECPPVPLSMSRETLHTYLASACDLGMCVCVCDLREMCEPSGAVVPDGAHAKAIEGLTSVCVLTWADRSALVCVHSSD